MVSGCFPKLAGSSGGDALLLAGSFFSEEDEATTGGQSRLMASFLNYVCPGTATLRGYLSDVETLRFVRWSPLQAEFWVPPLTSLDPGAWDELGPEAAFRVAVGTVAAHTIWMSSDPAVQVRQDVEALILQAVERRRFSFVAGGLVRVSRDLISFCIEEGVELGRSELLRTRSECAETFVEIAGGPALAAF